MEKHLPCQSQSDSSQPFLEGSRVILSSNEVLKVCEGYFLLESHPHKCRLSPESYRCHSKKVRRSGGVGGWVQDGYWLTAAPHRETRRPNESRSFPSRYAHNYDGCTLASAQYCSVSGNILTGDSSERIESPPCRVPATTVAGSRHGSPVEHCPLQHDEGSQRLRRRVGHSGERHNGRMRRDEWQPSISI